MSSSDSFCYGLAFKNFARSSPFKCHTGKVLFLLPPYLDRTYLLMIDGNSLLYGVSIGKSLFCVNYNIFGGICNKQRAEVFFALLAISLKTSFTHHTNGSVSFGLFWFLWNMKIYF